MIALQGVKFSQMMRNYHCRFNNAVPQIRMNLTCVHKLRFCWALPKFWGLQIIICPQHVIGVWGAVGGNLFSSYITSQQTAGRDLAFTKKCYWCTWHDILPEFTRKAEDYFTPVACCAVVFRRKWRSISSRVVCGVASGYKKKCVWPDKASWLWCETYRCMSERNNIITKTKW